jgi:hypothetical protein
MLEFLGICLLIYFGWAVISGFYRGMVMRKGFENLSVAQIAIEELNTNQDLYLDIVEASKDTIAQKAKELKHHPDFKNMPMPRIEAHIIKMAEEDILNKIQYVVDETKAVIDWQIGNGGFEGFEWNSMDLAYVMELGYCVANEERSFDLMRKSLMSNFLYKLFGENQARVYLQRMVEDKLSQESLAKAKSRAERDVEILIAIKQKKEVEKMDGEQNSFDYLLEKFGDVVFGGGEPTGYLSIRFAKQMGFDV